MSGIDSKLGGTDSWAQNKEGIQPSHGKPKGKPDNGHKQGEPHEPSYDHVQDKYNRYGDWTGKISNGDPLGTRRPWIKGRFQLSQLFVVSKTLVQPGMPGGTDGMVNRGNIVLKG